MHQRRQLKLPTDSDATGRTLGEEEIAALIEVISSGTLIGTTGTQVPKLESSFSQLLGVRFCRAVNSGSAACQTSYAALDLEPGSEVITTPITDMGAIGGLLYQLLVPVFADVDPETLNITPETIALRITPKTRAIVVTHLFGNPCDMEGIMSLAERHQLPVVEDCAQAYLATFKGQKVGTFGKVNSFSLQQGKHMTCGEGGLVVTQDQQIARRIRLFSDKGWPFEEEVRDHEFLAPNLRMSELQAAVAQAQVSKLKDCVDQRQQSAQALHLLLEGVAGITLPLPAEEATHVYWKYPLMVDPEIIQGGASALGAFLKDHGIYCVPRYIQKPAFECRVIKERVTFGTSGIPFQGRMRENPKDYPGVYRGLERILVLPWNEKYNEEHVHYIAEAIRRGVECLKG